MFDEVVCLLESHGHMMRGGTIVDATIIDAPSSTKNKSKTRDPEMKSTKKGEKPYFGMKAHIGVDAATGLIHTVTATPANEHDVTQAHNLIREDDEFVCGDSGCTGLEKRGEIVGDERKSKIEFRICKKHSDVKKIPEGFARSFVETEERRKSSLRAKVEHPFLIVKRTFGFRKTVYKGIRKNLNRMLVLFCSANLLMCARAGGLTQRSCQGTTASC